MMPIPTTHIPITAPLRKDTFSPSFKLFCTAAAVRELALTAMLIPMKPASAEATAPQTKTTDTHQPSMGTTPRIIATTVTNIARMRYSLLMKARAPSLMAADICLIRSEPWSCFRT